MCIEIRGTFESDRSRQQLTDAQVSTPRLNFNVQASFSSVLDTCRSPGPNVFNLTPGILSQTCKDHASRVCVTTAAMFVHVMEFSPEAVC